MNCPLCQNSLPLSKLTSRDYLSDTEFHLLECRFCGVGITEIPPSRESVDYYGTGYYNRKSGKFLYFWEEVFRLNHRKNARWLYGKFYPANVLEIGCGRAYILAQLKKSGCRVHCIESEEAAQWILENPEVHMATSEDGSAWPFDADCFHMVIFWHSLEHLSDPAGALREATRVLRPGHFLCISLPNIDSLQCRLNISGWFHLDVPRHRFHFGKDSLIHWLNHNGYEIAEVVSGDRIQNLFGWFQSLANLFTPQRCNLLYRFLQGGVTSKVANKKELMVQLMSIIFWLPMGAFGFLLEEILGCYGTVTVVARKKRK